MTDLPRSGFGFAAVLGVEGGVLVVDPKAGPTHRDQATSAVHPTATSRTRLPDTGFPLVATIKSN
ncbi:hypothetical protein ABZT02_31470 [Streptomyces sp. NPDC005402]|uniref:hypothetical protein n=1 Tax=Streptomyces sp. NPDC005402 TaxID=3155338 RepID=UPI0033B823F4